MTIEVKGYSPKGSSTASGIHLLGFGCGIQNSNTIGAYLTNLTRAGLILTSETSDVFFRDNLVDVNPDDVTDAVLEKVTHWNAIGSPEAIGFARDNIHRLIEFTSREDGPGKYIQCSFTQTACLTDFGRLFHAACIERDA